MLTLMCLLAAATLGAQSHGRGSATPHTPPPNTSNAPAEVPKASPDRDFGKDRAIDVGKGKQKGITKGSSSHKKSSSGHSAGA